MIGMNAKDALGAMEDLSIFNSLSNAAESRANAQVFRETAVALRERAGTIDRLKKELGDVQHNRNCAAELFIAAAKTLDHVIHDFAKAAGVSEDEMRKRYNVIRTQHFNRQVNEGISKGWFRHDPRLNLSEEQKQKWFVQGLDPDHGF